MTEISFPWPQTTLWPNNKPHWRVKGLAKAKYKEDCYYTALTQKVPSPGNGYSIPITITFCAPTKRKFDLDNALSAVKQLLDALAQVMNVDDHRFEPTIKRGDVVKGGAVIVKIN